MKGYAVELPNEAAAIAISNLPQVKWVEEESVVAVSLMEPLFGLKLSGRRTSFLKDDSLVG